MSAGDRLLVLTGSPSCPPTDNATYTHWHSNHRSIISAYVLFVIHAASLYESYVHPIHLAAKTSPNPRFVNQWRRRLTSMLPVHQSYVWYMMPVDKKLTHTRVQTDRQTDRQTCVIYSLNVCRATYSWSKFMQTAWQVVRAVWVELFILLEFSIEYLIEYWVPTDTGCDELNVNGKWQPITEMSYRKSRSLNSMAMSEFV